MDFLSKEYMEGVFFIILLIGLLCLLMVSANIETKIVPAKVLCLRHVWRRKDNKGWLPEKDVDETRRENSWIQCATCGKRPQQVTEEE